MMQLVRKYFSINLATRILLWMVLGVFVGIILGERASVLKPFGDLFIRLLIMAAIPLVFFNLLAGMTAMGDLKTFGRVGLRVLAFYLITMVVAMILGITVMQLIGAGHGFALTAEVPDNIGTMPNFGDFLMNMIPENIFKSFAEGNLIQIVVFAILIGITTLMMPENVQKKLEHGYNLLAMLMRKLVDLIMRVAPICLGALAAYTVGIYGSEIFGPLAKFVGGIYMAQIIMILFYLLLLYWFTGTGPKWFLSKTAELYATTVATCSSLASLTVSLDVAERKLKLPERIFSFTLPLGAQFNKDGSAIMISGVLIFTAQAIGIDFSISELVQIIIVGLILIEGSGGIPGGGLVTAMIFAQAFNLPLEIVTIIGGIYRLIDMGITTVNCMGDLVGTALVSKFELGWHPDQKTD